MNKSKKIALAFIVGSFFFFLLSFYSIYQVNSLVIDSVGLIHNSYVDGIDISNTKIEKINDTLNDVERKIASKEIIFVINDIEYKYSLCELGVGINKKQLKRSIIKYENELDYWKLFNNYSKNALEKKEYDYNYFITESKLDDFLTKLKNRFNITPVKGKLLMSKDRILSYSGEKKGYSIDIDKAKEEIINNFKVRNYKRKIVIDGNNIYLDNPHKTINTKISSFTTTFDDTVSRKYNIIAGAKQLDGKIIEPHKIFSFFDNVGPYTRVNNYVYYLGIMGNGVCQVATTLYNAELLGGLTTIERYNHGKKSDYVEGGLDATVAVTDGYVTDFRFKNDYDYPIYISAFVKGNKLTIELWSNENAKNGKEFKTKSVKIGQNTYKAYRYTYKNNKLIKTENLGISYYFAE